MENKQISLELTIEDINTVLAALGNLPYIQVYEIINRIQKQAEHQLQKKTVSSNGIHSEVLN